MAEAPLTMKAMACPVYGGPEVLQLVDIPRPQAGPGEVLVAVRASSVNAGDWHVMRGEPWLMRLAFGMSRPKCPVLGSDFAGTVVAVGPGVTEFSTGDDVFGDASGDTEFGAFAEFLRIKAEYILKKPAKLTYEQAAAIPMASVTAVTGIRDVAKVSPGQRVMVMGASGGVGSFAVQIAKALGAHVTGVCRSDKKDVVRACGADEVIAYDEADITQLQPGCQPFDVIFDAAAYQSIFSYRHVMSPQGIFVVGGGALGPLLQAAVCGPFASWILGKRFANYMSTPNRERLTFVMSLVESNKLTPQIDCRFMLHQVPEAIRYIEQRNVRGKVVIVM